MSSCRLKATTAGLEDREGEFPCHGGPFETEPSVRRNAIGSLSLTSASCQFGTMIAPSGCDFKNNQILATSNIKLRNLCMLIQSLICAFNDLELFLNRSHPSPLLAAMGGHIDLVATWPGFRRDTLELSAPQPPGVTPTKSGHFGNAHFLLLRRTGFPKSVLFCLLCCCMRPCGPSGTR